MRRGSVEWRAGVCVRFFSLTTNHCEMQLIAFVSHQLIVGSRSMEIRVCVAALETVKFYGLVLLLLYDISYDFGLCKNNT